MYIYICMYIYIYIYIYIHTHTHTHTHIGENVRELSEQDVTKAQQMYSLRRARARQVSASVSVRLCACTLHHISCPYTTFRAPTPHFPAPRCA